MKWLGDSGEPYGVPRLVSKSSFSVGTLALVFISNVIRALAKPVSLPKR